GPFESEHADPAVRQAQMHAYRLDEPVWPTFLGSGADAARLVLLAVGLALLAGGIVASVRKLRFYDALRAPLIVGGLVLIAGYILMITQAPGTSGSTGFVQGQFLRYLDNLVHGDLGRSFSHPTETVNEIIGRSAINSFVVGG